MKKKFIPLYSLAAIVLSAIGIIAQAPLSHAAQSVFNSNQISTTTTYGYVLQSNGANVPASFVATSTLGFAGGVTSFNTRTGAVTLTSGDVTTALGFTPLSNITGLVTQGTNVTITGSGTSGSPYVINSSGSGGSSFAYPFNYFNNTGTTSPLLLLASTTIGNGTQANGLTISGGATTTLNAYFASNVGIGTMNPGAKLSVLAGVNTTLGNNIGLSIGDNDGSGALGNLYQIGFNYSSSLLPASVIGAVISNAASFTQSDLIFATRTTTNNVAPTERMRITAAGNVGIGTTTPTNPLTLPSGSASVPSLSFGDTGTGFYRSGGGSIGFTALGSIVAFINPNGIGLDGSATLSNGATGQNAAIQPSTTGTIISRNIADANTALTVFQQNSGSTGDILDLKNSGGVVDVITQAGNLGIGTTSPATNFSIQGNQYTSGTAFFGGAILATSTLTLTPLATPAGQFAAFDPTGKLIGTSTPSGSNSAFSPAANYATTAGLPAYTYVTGVITEVSNGALSVDGANPAVGQTVLVKNESGACTSSSGGCNNGLYNVTAAGSGIAAFVLTRNSNYNSSSNVIPGIITYVISGATNDDDFWAMTSAAPITVGTTALTYTEVSGGGSSVTSVAQTVPSFLSISGSPITTSGTLAIGYSGTALPTANGGTGLTSIGDGALLFGGGGTANLTALATSTSGSFLQLSAATGRPVWSTTLGLANGGTNATSFTTSGNALYYNGTSLATAPLTTAITIPYASSTGFSTSYASSTKAFFGQASIPSLGTPAGAFAAVDPTGKIIATTSPSGAIATDYQDFTSSGTWTKPAACSTGNEMVFIQAWGAGGGNGGNTPEGGGGAYDEFHVLCSSLGSTVTVTVGTGGSGQGGNSSFGTSVIAYGGAAGGATFGGGGGGLTSAGSAGAGGGIIGGAQGSTGGNSTFGGGGGGSGGGGSSGWGGGGGGGSGGGSSVWGGGGGGQFGGGTSVYGGAGGTNAAGSIPGGGGTTGARGEVKVWTISS